MKNNILVVVLIILVSLLAGVALLTGINSTVQLAMSPIVLELKQIEINMKQGPRSLDNTQILNQLSAIEKQLNVLQNKISARPSLNIPQPPGEDFNKVYNIDIGASPINGKTTAPVTIVEFSDFQCPFCSRFYPPVKEVLKAYPDQVKFTIKNFPLSFHPNARPAAKLALAANEQGKYYELVELLLKNGADVSEVKVKEYAKDLNLDYTKLMNDVKNKDAEYEKRISDDTVLGGQVDVQGTPTFFLNGKKTQARDFNSFKAEIDKILAGK